MTKSLELDTEMRWESADFIGARSRMIGCNRPDIKQQPPLQVEHTKNLRKKGGVHIKSYCLIRLSEFARPPLTPRSSPAE